jgi:ATP-dependent Clp protease adaptor protein ClpS
LTSRNLSIIYFCKGLQTKSCPYRGGWMSDKNQTQNTVQSSLALAHKKELKEPSLFKVLLHNDDFTPMDFVVDLLVFIFDKSEAQAQSIMLEVHNSGVGLAGLFPFEIAEAKVTLVLEKSKKNEYPLRCTMEEDKG